MRAARAAEHTKCHGMPPALGWGVEGCLGGIHSMSLDPLDRGTQPNSS